MGEEISSTVNLDVNLGPDPVLGVETATNYARSDWGNGPAGELEYLRFRSQHESRFRRIGMLPVLAGIDITAVDLSHTSANEASLPAGDGIITGGERVSEDSKKCENGSKVMEEDNVTEEKKDVEKIVGSDGSFSDCYICMDLSKDPVVTNCGHLYCWSCLYHWLQVSKAKECPVCKGEVSVKTLTPMYGRGGHKRESEKVASTKIPLRPQARRVESLRNKLRMSRYMPMEMIRKLEDSTERESGTGERRPLPFFCRYMTSRGVRAEQNQSSEALVAPSYDINDLSSNISREHEGENRNPRSSRALTIRREREQSPGRMSPFNLTSSERLEDAYLITDAFGSNQDQNNINPLVGLEDMDSFSSIVGVINSESQVDTAAEIDSMFTVSTSSSVERHESGSRVSDVDNANSRSSRLRRRLA